MKAFIYTGGSILENGICEYPEEGDLVIAADGGYHNARRLGVTPSVLLGDMDSLRRDESLPQELEILTLPPEKDDTDTQLAVRLAVERGAKKIVIIGGLDGRLDHTLSNLAILDELNHQRIRAVITNGQNRVRFLRNDGHILLQDACFRYFSLIAADEKVRGVTVEGCKYPLKNATLFKTRQYAVSNEIVGNCALLEVRKGAIWLIESRDP